MGPYCKNCPDDAASLRVEQGLMGNSGVVITKSSLRSASRTWNQHHLQQWKSECLSKRDNLFMAKSSGLFVPLTPRSCVCFSAGIRGVLLQSKGTRPQRSRIMPSIRVSLFCPLVCSATESKQKLVKKISGRRADAGVLCVFVCSGTKASSEARSSRVFHSGYGEHFTITTISQWVQGTITPHHLHWTHTIMTHFQLRYLAGGPAKLIGIVQSFLFSFTHSEHNRRSLAE